MTKFNCFGTGSSEIYNTQERIVVRQSGTNHYAYYWNNQYDGVFEWAWDSTDPDGGVLTQKYKLYGSSISGTFNGWNSNGTACWWTDFTNDLYIPWTCSTAYDLSTATIGTTFATSGVLSNFSTGGSWFFGADGNVYCGDGLTTGTIYRYNCSTAFDFSTVSSTAHSSKTVDTGHEARPQYFSTDGTKMWVFDWPTSGTCNIWEYTLSTAFNLSTMSYNSVTGFVDYAARDAITSADGEYFFIGHHSERDIHWVIPLATAGSLQSLKDTDIYQEQLTKTRTAAPTHPQISNFRYLYKRDPNRPAAPGSWNYQGLPIQYLSSSAAWVVARSDCGWMDVGHDGKSFATVTLTREEERYWRSDRPREGYLKSDGTKGIQLIDTLNGYNELRVTVETLVLSTAYNSSTLDFGMGEDTLQNYDYFTDNTRFNHTSAGWSGEHPYPRSVWIDDSGIHMFISDGDKVHGYTLTTAWDVTAWTYEGAFDTGSTDGSNINGRIYCTPGGRFLGIIWHGTTNNDPMNHKMYEMTTPFDVTTITGTWASADRYVAWMMDYQSASAGDSAGVPGWWPGGRKCWTETGDLNDSFIYEYNW